MHVVVPVVVAIAVTSPLEAVMGVLHQGSRVTMQLQQQGVRVRDDGEC